MTRRVTAGLFAVPALLVLAIACRDIVAPNRAENSSEPASLQELSGRIVVHPGDMKGWVFYNDQNGTACSGSNCQLVAGPVGQPGGSGSAELAVVATSEGKALILPGYQGVRFDQLTTLGYSTYRQTADAGNNLAIALQFNADYDLDDAASGYQGRLVFEPYVGVGGNVVVETWQTWDAKAGKWWGTRTTVTVNGASVTNPCIQSTPCTWSQLLAAFPDVGVHAVYGAVVLKAGSGWANFRGNVDNLTIGVDSVAATYDFELSAPPLVPSEAPDSIPSFWLSNARIVEQPDSIGVPIYAELLALRFAEGASQSDRESAIWSVNGTVVGGHPIPGAEGTYAIQVPDDSTGAAVARAAATLSALSSVRMAVPALAIFDAETYRRPTDGVGLKRDDWILNADSAFKNVPAWAASAVGAPFAWGCAAGQGQTVAILDFGIAAHQDLAGRVASGSITNAPLPSRRASHGQRTASVATASANNGIGIAGIAYESSVLLLDVGQYIGSAPDTTSQGGLKTDPFKVVAALESVRASGARVLSISLGIDVNPGAQGQAVYQDWAEQLAGILTNQGTSAPPLVVVSASNNGASGNAQWGTYGPLRTILPATTISVSGASHTPGSFAPGATRGGIIDLVAPGEDVSVFDAINGITSEDGSSFATPFVAGAAALLLSIDPRLSNAEVRAFLVDSAPTARSVQGIKFLDVAAAARAVAARNGAPLCGNRVWTDAANGFHAQRGSGSEQLFTVGTSPFDATYANVHHGGRRIEMAFGLRYVLNGSTWSAGTWSPDDIGEYSGAFKGSGAWFQDHDDRFGTYITGVRGPSSISFEILKYGVDGITADSTLQAVAAAPALVDARTTSCVREELNDSTGVYDCVASASEGVVDLPTQWSSGSGGTFTASNVLHALEPQGRFVVVLVGIRRHTSTLSPTWDPCFGSVSEFPAVRCRGYSSNNQVSLRTELYHVNLQTGAATRLSVPEAVLAEGATGDEVFWLSIDERGDEIAVQVGGISLGTSGFGCTNGRHQWLRFGASVTDALSTGYSESIPGTTICDGALDGGGSAALRAGR